MHIMSILFMLLFLSSVNAFTGHAGGPLSTTPRGWLLFFLSSQHSSLGGGISLPISDGLPLIVLFLCGSSGMVLSVCPMVFYYGLVLMVLSFLLSWFPARVGSLCFVDFVRLFFYLFTF